MLQIDHSVSDRLNNIGLLPCRSTLEDFRYLVNLPKFSLLACWDLIVRSLGGPFGVLDMENESCPSLTEQKNLAPLASKWSSCCPLKRQFSTAIPKLLICMMPFVFLSQQTVQRDSDRGH